MVFFLFGSLVFAADSTTAATNAGGTGTMGITPGAETASGAVGTTIATPDKTSTAVSDTGSEKTVVPTSTGFDEDKAYNWLKTNAKQAVSILDQTLTIVALNNKNINVQNLVDVLKAQQDSNGCFPKGACKVSDSALGTLALYSVNQDISKGKDYLLGSKTNALVPGLKQGEWRLQLDVSGSGTCQVDYGSDNKSKTFTIINGTIKNTAGKYYIDIAKELDGSLIGAKISQSVSVDCKDLTGTISLVYYLRSSNSFFVLDSQSLSAGAANLKIINACFRSAAGTGSCDLDSTLMATWALLESDVSLGEIGTLAYLESTASSTNLNDLNKALLVRILQKSGNANSYFDNILISAQKNGAWGRGDSYNTAWGLFALQKASGVYGDAVTSSTGYLQKRIANDGSWGNARNTAMTLIALHGSDLAKGIVAVSSAGQEDTNAGVDEICAGKAKDRMDRTGCASPLCSIRKECACENTELNCGGPNPNCAPCPETGGTTGGVSDLQSSGETTSPETPPTSKGTSSETTPADTGSSFWVWIIVLMLVLVLGGGGIIFYLKSQGKLEDFLANIKGMFGKKPAGPSFEQYRKQAETNKMQARAQPVGVQRPGVQRPIQGQRPLPPVSRPVIKTAPLKKPTYDDALEKSIKDAENLLKGNK